MKRNFFFAWRARVQKSPVRLRIRPGISQSNTLLSNAAVSSSLSAASLGSKGLQFFQIYILVYKLRTVVPPILSLFIGILPNNALKSLYQTPKLFCFAKYFL